MELRVFVETINKQNKVFCWNNVQVEQSVLIETIYKRNKVSLLEQCTSVLEQYASYTKQFKQSVFMRKNIPMVQSVFGETKYKWSKVFLL